MLRRKHKVGCGLALLVLACGASAHADETATGAAHIDSVTLAALDSDALGGSGQLRGGVALPAPLPENARDLYDGNFLVVMGGAGATSEFEGSRHMDVLPGLGLMGRYKGVSFATRGIGLSVDLLPDDGQGRWSFSLGPVVKYNANRAGTTHDAQVNALGRLSPWVDAGLSAGVGLRRLTNRYDSISFGVDVREDISGHGLGLMVAPGVGYFTPIGPGTAVSASAFADFIEGSGARYNYSISPAQSLASGLPVYNAHGGLKDAGWQLTIGHDLDNNIRNGGLALVAGVSYTRLLGSAASTPITAQADQWTFGVGFAYAF